jgi:hypothetical protein
LSSYQRRVVGPAIEKAVSAFEWPLVRSIALKPLVHFAYFPHGRPMFFTNFADREERIAKRLHAFDAAAEAGWPRVVQALREYDVLPPAFFVNSASYFAEFRTGLLATH